MAMRPATRPAIHPELAVIGEPLASGSLAEPSAHVEQAGRNWRVRIFEYGLSRNSYPVAVQPVAAGPVAVKNTPGEIAATAPLLWTRRSAREALRHLEGVGCFAGHAWKRECRECHGLLGFFSQPSIGLQGPEATLTLLGSGN